MAPKLPALFKKRARIDAIGFDLSDDYAKIAHVKLAGLKREVAGLASREVRGASDDDIAAFVRQAIVGFKVTDPAASVMVPLHTIITRSIEIPSKDPEEIREIVSLQASRHTPYSRSEIIIDTLDLGVVRESYTKVLLVIVPRDIVMRHTRILEKAGLDPEKVFFPPEAIAYACAKILGNEGSDEAVAIVHMDATFTSFLVIRRGRLLFMRGIAIGADHLLEEKEIYGDRFVDELGKSLESYLNDEAGPKPSLLLLTGVVAEVTELDDFFRETLNMPIKHQTYFQHFSISREAKAVASGSRQVSFFNVVAPLLLHDRLKLNLVTEEQKLKIHLERRGRDMIKLGVLVMVLLAAVFGFFTEKVFFRREYLRQITERYAKVREDAKQLEGLFAKTQLVKGYLARRGNSIECLSVLYDVLPPDVRLASLKYEQGEKFTAKGTSRTMASAFSFVSNLERSAKFKGVKTKYVTTRMEEGADVADFEIQMMIVNETEGESA